MLAVAYEKTQELARDLRSVGCGDLDVEGNESVMITLFSLSLLNICYFMPNNLNNKKFVLYYL